MGVKRPELLNSDLKKTTPIQASALSVTVALREKSTARLTLPLSASPLPFRSFVNVYTHKGFLGVFRSTNTSITSQSGRTFNLTHAIDTLRDSVWDEQTTFEGVRESFLRLLFYHQKTQYWQLGTVDQGGYNYKSPKINYTNLSDLLSKFLQDNIDLYAEYDFSTTPWTVNFKKLPEEISARFSLTRNAESCQITYDDKSLCNRLYLAVNTPEQVNGITKYTAVKKVYENAESIDIYDVVEKTASVKTDEITDGDADKWANDFLGKYAEPEVSITVDGYELWRQTGNIYDEASVGKRARVALPDYGVSTVQRIESVTYPDALNQPTAIAVSLATRQKTFTSSMSNLEKEVEKVGGVAGGAALSAANAEEVTAWSLIMQKVEEAVDGTGIIALWETGITIDAVSGAKIYSISQGFDAVSGEVMVNRAAIDANSKEIGLAVEQGQNNAAAIKVNADAISGKVSQTDFDALGNRVGKAETEIKTTAEGLSVKVNQTDFDALGNRVGDAETQIEVNSEAIKAKADLILLEGLVKASELQTAIAEINYQTSQAVETLLLDANQVNANHLSATSLTHGDALISQKPLTMGAITFDTKVLMPSTLATDLNHSHAVSVADDGTVTLGEAALEGGFFKIADTKAYKEGVSAAKNNVYATLSGWSTGQNIVTLSNDKVYPVDLPSFTSSVTAFNADTHKAIVRFYSNEIGNAILEEKEVDASSVYEAGYNAGLAAADTTAAYKAGWDAARAEVRRVIYSTGSEKRVEIYGPGSTVDSLAKFWTIDVKLGFTSHLANQSTNQVTAQIYANLRIGGSTALTETDSNTISIGGGIM